MNLGKEKMASTKGSVLATNNVRIMKIKDIVAKHVETYFSATLGREPDIVNIVNALVLLESGGKYNVNAVGRPLDSNIRGSMARNYMTSSTIVAKLETATNDEKDRINQGLTALGLMQVMGWNFIQGASLTGRCEIERLRPDLAPQLVVTPATDLWPLILGEGNMEKAILAGLIMLEGKYRAVYATPAGWSVKGDSYNRNFFSKISGAVAAYLGLGRADANNTTPEFYSSQIVGGSFYVKANGTDAIKVSDTKINIASSNGPSTNGSNQGKIGSVGCTPVKKTPPTTPT